LLQLALQHLFSPFRGYGTRSRLKPEPQSLRLRLHRALRQPQHLPFRRASRAAAMGSSRPSTFHSLGEMVTRLSPARLRQALLWNCCATANPMIERSQINPDNSSWSLLGFLLETTS